MHIPVLLDEVIENLKIQADGYYADCTFGRGGHSQAIMQHLDKKGRLIAIDKDPLALEKAGQVLAADSRLNFFHGSFANLEDFIEQTGITHKLNGMLFDLGVSSPQLDDPNRGFSFQQDGALDMRMDNSQGITAADWIMQATQADIEKTLREFGEERFARRVASAIVTYRKHDQINSTLQLANIVSEAIPTWEKHKHPATRTFQAIRIFINNELGELQIALKQAVNVLAVGGRLLVISFHSLEDRIVKRFMRDQARGDDFPRELPVTYEQLKPCLKIINKAIYPAQKEIERNPRSRSAVLRVAERLL